MTVERLATVSVVLVSALVVAGCDPFWSSDAHPTRGSGNTETQTREVAPFSSVELAGANDVVVRVGREHSVRLTGDDNLLDQVTTDVSDGRLVIDNRGTFTTSGPMAVEITMPDVDAFTLSGSGVLRATGRAEQIDAELSGAGDLQLGGLAAGDVEALLSGTGRMTVNATGRLDATLSGTGQIVFVGAPAQVTRNVTGTGVITKR